ncbi:DUF6114 domain-containing protein [Streptomyces sp. NBC_01408]|uniref:DUF6114 domain-containing protein n=1 Tax=Streptomyces sp. NBC_01408 TaxID=2903855 RepID=UPI00225B195A|nr:DUF6114 domain-containing protein [Streptomyces sp. NBC_01408]MCX4695669.1 DUF6114 domain-containing protein [Streptomyces sp. NBC_01408]
MFLDLFGRHRNVRVGAAGARHQFRIWRGKRPFWAGLFTLVAALPIIYIPYAHLDFGSIPLALSTAGGAGSLVIGVLLVALGLSLWFHQQVRVFAGITVILLALVSFPVANLGGLLIGLFSGLIGGSLACAWIPPTGTSEPQPATNHAPTTIPAGEEHGEE